MNPIRTRAGRLAAVVALAISLGGCITVFPKVEPAGLYRFGTTAPPVDKGPADKLVGVYKTPTTFTRASASDTILTMTQGQAAYIAGARWVAPASVLFEEAVSRAFDADPGRARLIGRGEVARPELILRLDVQAFETDYSGGAKAAPEVLIQVRAALNRSQDRSLVGEKLFEARVKASNNRVSSIVTAYDAATTTVLSEITAWTSQNAATAPR
jgi:cholesterol transport system auxiliary component